MPPFLRRTVLLLLLLPAIALCPACLREPAAVDEGRVRPYDGNPFYWQYGDEPVVLIGASDYHNIFQRPDLVEHLDLLASVGGNYVRNSMASREIMPDHHDLWPFAIVERTDDPLINVYDLDRWNDEYWERFERFLEETAGRSMIVEIELWERHDYYRTRDQAGWLRHPYNPDNNVNYSADEARLPTGEFPAQEGHPFFAAVPALENNAVLLRHQEAFVDKILSYSLDFDHVLYNMNNETREHHAWGEYWGSYIRDRALERGKVIEITDMQDAHDVTDVSVRRVMESDLYTFVDVSQNNFQRGDTHWERIHFIREGLLADPKPITNVKVYGSDRIEPVEFWGSERDGVERFWRNLIGGTSAVRFHRPDWGIGLSPTAQAHVRSARLLVDAMHVFSCEPRNDLLSDRGSNEAYLLADVGREYALYFPDGGSVLLDLSDASGSLRARWLDPSKGAWVEEDRIEAGAEVHVEAPSPGHWILLLTSP